MSREILAKYFSLRNPRNFFIQSAIMADAVEAEGGAKKRAFRKFAYRGVDLDQLLDMKHRARPADGADAQSTKRRFCGVCAVSHWL